VSQIPVPPLLPVGASAPLSSPTSQCLFAGAQTVLPDKNVFDHPRPRLFRALVPLAEYRSTRPPPAKAQRPVTLLPRQTLRSPEPFCSRPCTTSPDSTRSGPIPPLGHFRLLPRLIFFSCKLFRLSLHCRQSNVSVVDERPYFGAAFFREIRLPLGALIFLPLIRYGPTVMHVFFASIFKTDAPFCGSARPAVGESHSLAVVYPTDPARLC